jgi:Cof subfamily protein (haloacid dehalogenase superfamily)
MSISRWLVALDLDGTLVGHDLKISPRVRQTVAAARSLGHIVTLATGRRYLSAHFFARQLGIGDEPLICGQGAQVRSPSSIIFETPLPLPSAHTAIRWANQRQIAIHAYLDDGDYISARSPDTPFYESMHDESDIQVVGDLIAFLTRPPMKLLLIVPADEAPQLQAELAAILGQQATVVRSHARYIEVVHPEVNKGTALLALANYLDIPPSCTLGIGDNHNDIPLIQAAAVGIAMGNASAEVKAGSNWVAPTLQDDGAAQALERFLPGLAPLMAPYSSQHSGKQ